MADIDAALVQKVLDVSKRKRETDVHHDRQADDLGACLEVTKWTAFGHDRTVGKRPARLNQISSDRARQTLESYVTALTTSSKFALTLP